MAYYAILSYYTVQATFDSDMCLLLYRTMACFERNLHNQISSGDSIQRTTFCGNEVVDTTFLYHDPL